ncbi:threonine/homoserine/homoserine lactone efflux protein [Agrobacterium vitis]|nr:threonine/homoserine/homoserine lactone efflux protein [Agrobacterium vitis]MBE1436828.1 threonine/homoserine/homoserine lactone efflux protein [Agrobacterium vitis]
MVINFSLLSLYVITVITMIAIPGPVAILVTGAGLGGGPKRALVTILGTNLASLLLIGASMLMVTGLLVVDERVFAAIKLLGALYIAYLGYEMVRDTSKGPDFTTMSVTRQSGGFLKGFGMCISNPKDIIFFASFFPQFLTITPNTHVSISVLTVVWIILDFSLLMGVYLLANRLLRPGLHHHVLRASGVLLLVIGLASAAVSAFSSVSA